ncbi:MAG: radical protein, partial [Evtepia sp.]|nr:radical protein [Evtepia sp.]
IRHLLLPGRLQQAKEVMDWVSDAFSAGSVLFSLMGQYVPFGRATETKPLNRTIRSSELRAAISYMQALELSGYTQDSSSANEAYVPNFDLSGL